MGQDSAVPFRKIMDAYKAVSANVATPEGQKYDSVIAQEFSSRYMRAVKDCSAAANGHAANAADYAGGQERISAADDGGPGDGKRYLPAAEAGEGCVYSSAKARVLGAGKSVVE